MSGDKDARGKMFDQVVESFRKTAETALEVQKELFQQWQKNWPGLSQLQAPWLDQLRQFQRSWASAVVELVRKHREALDRQYQAGIEALEEAFSVAESDNPEQFRKRAEELCRKNLESLKEISEAQIREFQSAAAKWVELFTKGASSDKSGAAD